MERINPGDERVVKLHRKEKWDREAAYRLSGFCLLLEDGGVYLLHNTLTGQIYRLTAAEYAAAARLKAETADAAYVRANGLTELAVHRCVVHAGYDECAEYLSALRVMRLMQPPADGYTVYEIFPTTGCNARCVYCFEKGFTPATMTEDTALATADFISRTRGSRPVLLWWFGGEPLAAASRIDTICRELERRKVAYSSTITTNATLMTPEMAKRARDLWKLKSAIVSLDGDRAAYSARKRYVDPRLHHFDAALRGVHLLAEQGVSVDLRCNFDADNLDSLTLFVEEMHREFPDPQNVKVHFAVLYQEYDKGTAPGLLYRVRAMEDAAASYGLMRSDLLKPASFVAHACIADNLDRSVVIEPDGHLQNCDHLSDEHRFGNVWDGVTDRARFEELKRPLPVETVCKSCPYLPIGTPFRKAACPTREADCCRELVQAMTENRLHRLAVQLKDAGRENA